MKSVLLAKFNSSPRLRLILLDTAPAYLENRTRHDHHWGSGSDDAGGGGKNRLGHLLTHGGPRRPPAH